MRPEATRVYSVATSVYSIAASVYLVGGYAVAKTDIKQLLKGAYTSSLRAHTLEA